MILSQALNQAALKGASHPAILDLGKTISYGELKKNVSQLSYLYQSEIPAGDKVGMLFTNSALAAQTFFALSNIGNSLLLFQASDNDSEIAEDIKNLGLKHLVVTGDMLLRARNLKKSYGISINIIELDKKRGGEYDSSFSPPPERPLHEQDPFLIFRQTDSPIRKYMFFSHQKIYQSVAGTKKFYRFTPTDRMLGQISWGHPFGLIHSLLLPLFTGCTCVVDPQSPSVEEFVEFISTNRITRFSGPPKFYLQLLSFCATQKYVLPGVKSITVGMGSLSLTMRKTYKLLNVPVLRCYGKPEIIWTIAMDSIEEGNDIEQAKSKPILGMKCKVLDQNGDEVPGPGAREGLLAVTSESVMSGYFHPEKEMAEQATRQALRGTWLYTDEIGRLEGEGDTLTVAVLGKAADMISDGTVYISPRKIDEEAKKIGGVADAAGFVITSNEGTRTFAAALVMEGKGINEATMLEILTAKLDPKKYPITKVYFTDVIPTSEFGSVDRQALTRRFSLA